MVFIDRPIRLGRGEVGSSNIASQAVYRAKLGVSAVGSTQQGTLTASKLIGTVAALDIGSGFFSYGSMGTGAGRMARYAAGSVGTVRATYVRAPYGSFTHFGGSVPASKILTGTITPARVGPIQSIPGTQVALKVPTIDALRGTISTPRYSRSQAVGTWTGAYGSFGSLAGRVARAQLGSFLRLGNGLGTVPGRYGSHGTVAGRIARIQYGSFPGTVAAPLIRGIEGSFVRFMGSLQGTRIKYGTINRARFMQALGTHLNGSWSGNEARNRYAVWPTAFPDALYLPWFALQTGSLGSNFNVTTGRAQWHVGYTRRAAGSMKYYVTRDAGPDPSGTVRPFGTLHVYALRN